MAPSVRRALDAPSAAPRGATRLAPAPRPPHSATPARSRPEHPALQTSSRSRTRHVAHFQRVGDSAVTKRLNELDKRKLYLTNFWYAAGFGAQVARGKFIRTTLLDTPLVIWRDVDSDQLRCITDQSPHDGEKLPDGLQPCSVALDSGAKLSAIQLQGGARYDATTGMPLGGEASADAAPLEVWDVVEKGGFIWFFFGLRETPAKDRPSIPWVPQLNKPGWHAVHGEVLIKSNHWMVIENVIDMAHVPYVHAGTVGNHAAFTSIEIKQTPTSLSFAFPIESHHEEGTAAAVRVDTLATACLPSTCFIQFKLPWGLGLVSINSVVPIDEKTTAIRFCNMRNFLPIGLIDPIVRQGMKNILGEDRVILEQLKPENMVTELSLKADAPQMEFRKMRERFIAAGMAVAPGRRTLHSLKSQQAMSR